MLVEYIRDRPQVRNMQPRRQKAEPFAIIVPPTRELAIEVHATLLDLCFTEKVGCVLAYGGIPIEQQIAKLNEGCEILDATPGRLLALMQRGSRVFGGNGHMSPDRFRFLVYDEADALYRWTNKRRIHSNGRSTLLRQ